MHEEDNFDIEGLLGNSMRLATMKVQALKTLISDAGMSHDDCFEKGDLRKRALEAMTGANVGRGSPSASTRPPSAEKRAVTAGSDEEGDALLQQVLGRTRGGSRIVSVDDTDDHDPELATTGAESAATSACCRCCWPQQHCAAACNSTRCSHAPSCSDTACLKPTFVAAGALFFGGCTLLSLSGGIYLPSESAFGHAWRIAAVAIGAVVGASITIGALRALACLTERLVLAWRHSPNSTTRGRPPTGNAFDAKRRYAAIPSVFHTTTVDATDI